MELAWDTMEMAPGHNETGIQLVDLAWDTVVLGHKGPGRGHNETGIQFMDLAWDTVGL